MCRRTGRTTATSTGWMTLVAVLDHLKIDKAHVVGLSMGAYTAAVLGFTYPNRALSLTIAGAGSGSERALIEEFRKNSKQMAEDFLKKGTPEVVKAYGAQPGAHLVPGEGPARLRGVQQDVRRARRSGFEQHGARLSGRAALDLRFRSRTAQGHGAEPDRMSATRTSRAWSRASCSSNGCRPRASWCCPRPAMW